jgi:hypothetical protein
MGENFNADINFLNCERETLKSNLKDNRALYESESRSHYVIRERMSELFNHKDKLCRLLQELKEKI